jgi:hypothetical protein
MRGKLARPKQLTGQAGAHPKRKGKEINPRRKSIKWRRILWMRKKKRIETPVKLMTHLVANQGTTHNLPVSPMQIGLVSTTKLLLVLPQRLKDLLVINLHLERNWHLQTAPCKVDFKHI